MKWEMAVSAAVLAISTSAQAAVTPTLQSVVNNGSDFTFNYQGTLAGDAGLKNGSRLVIFDFAGYVPGSIFAPSSSILTSTEMVTTGLLTAPGFVDDPTIPNLVFTWNGGNFHTSGGPYSDIDFNGIGARSFFSNLVLGVYAGKTVKNNGLGPGGAGTNAYNTGYVSVPGSAPEPAAWALMILGFGVAGASLRRRKVALA